VPAQGSGEVRLEHELFTLGGKVLEQLADQDAAFMAGVDALDACQSRDHRASVRERLENLDP
jgi:hypothetical protein